MPCAKVGMVVSAGCSVPSTSSCGVLNMASILLSIFVFYGMSTTYLLPGRAFTLSKSRWESARVFGATSPSVGFAGLDQLVVPVLDGKGGSYPSPEGGSRAVEPIGESVSVVAMADSSMRGAAIGGTIVEKLDGKSVMGRVDLSLRVVGMRVLWPAASTSVRPTAVDVVEVALGGLPSTESCSMAGTSAVVVKIVACGTSAVVVEIVACGTSAVVVEIVACGTSAVVVEIVACGTSAVVVEVLACGVVESAVALSTRKKTDMFISQALRRQKREVPRPYLVGGSPLDLCRNIIRFGSPGASCSFNQSTSLGKSPL
jgi:hypothetical protein